MTDITNIIVTLVENTVLRRCISPLPKDTLMKRPIAADREPVNKENMDTKPATTLLIP